MNRFFFFFFCIGFALNHDINLLIHFFCEKLQAKIDFLKNVQAQKACYKTYHYPIFDCF